MPSSEMRCRVDRVWTDVSEERQFTQDVHGSTSQKTAFFIVTAVKTSTLTGSVLYVMQAYINVYMKGS
jgi:hypothetical protein